MRLNWGTGIAMFYSTFVIVLVAVVIKTTTFDNSLVSEDYYADDLNYQKQYEKLKNSKNLLNDLEIANNFNGGQIKFQFPVDLGVPQGEIYFFCPSDSKLDFRIPIKADSEYQQFISTEQLKSGLWRIKVDWQAGGQPYFKELALAL
jgi:hypothetical protein